MIIPVIDATIDNGNRNACACVSLGMQFVNTSHHMRRKLIFGSLILSFLNELIQTHKASMTDMSSGLAKWKEAPMNRGEVKFRAGVTALLILAIL
jgi:hypothetical protein